MSGFICATLFAATFQRSYKPAHPSPVVRDARARRHTTEMTIGKRLEAPNGRMHYRAELFGIGPPAARCRWPDSA